MKTVAAFVLGVCACAASEPAPRTEVAAAPPTTSASAAKPESDEALLAMIAPDASVSAVFGSGGLGETGTGDGAGGSGGSVGLGKVRDAGAAHAPIVHNGDANVTGRLPPEVIRRIVRQRFGRVRVCYERALARDPTLTGSVVTRFVIDTSGAVTKVDRDPSSTLQSAEVVACVLDTFKTMTFPQPEGGIVTVVYPLVFSPS